MTLDISTGKRRQLSTIAWLPPGAPTELRFDGCPVSSHLLKMQQGQLKMRDPTARERRLEKRKMRPINKIQKKDELNSKNSDRLLQTA